MKHIILLFFVISLITGISTMLLISIDYLKHKKVIIKYVIQCDLFFTGLLFLDIVTYYWQINRIKENSFMYMLVLLGILLCGIGMIYFLFQAVYLGLNIKVPTYWHMVYWLIAGVFVALLLTLNILYATKILDKYFEYPSSFMTHNIFTAVGAFMNIFLLIKHMKQKEFETRKVAILGIVAITILVPISIIVNTMEYYIDFGIPMPFSPITYFIANLLTLVIAIKFFNGAPEVSELSGGVLLKDYLSAFDITERELEIVSWVVEGLSNQEIGFKLFISPNTVKNHIYNIYKKMGINNRFELMSQMNQYIKKG